MSADTEPVVMLVDDNIVNLKVAVEELRAHNLSVITARTGEAALERAAYAQPDLILLDVGLPGIDGFETCRRLKANPNTRDIPVLFMTALADTSDKLRGFEAGGVDYITKPIEVADVRARVTTHLTIRSLQKCLEERVAELDAFAHTVAHDLKNPLAGVLGYAQLIQKLAPEPRSQTFTTVLDGLLASCHKMNAIVDELLTLSSVRKLEEVETRPLVMGQVVEEALGRLRHVIDASGATIVQPEVWPAAQGYGPWVEAVWTNYISNAIKYGGSPPVITLGATASARALPDEPPMVRFSVHDRGPGLSEAERSRLFREYTRLEQHRGLQGHGLGLSIVQRAVRKLGGTVGVESRPGEGSTFFFTLPAAEQAPASPPPSAPPVEAERLTPPSEAWLPLQILVVDDDATNRQLLLLNLASLGHSADTAHSGAEAVAACERRSYDVIFMDMEMAGMDGLEATRHIRRRAGGGADPCIIACTASTAAAARDNCLAAGMSDFALKPVQPELLAKLIKCHTADGQQGGDQPPAEQLSSAHDDGQLLDEQALAILRKVVGGDPAMFALVIESFLDDSPRLMEAILAAAAQGEAQELYRTAHTLKSLAASFGAAALASLCRELEQIGASGTVEGSGLLLPDLQRSYQQVAAALKALSSR